MLQIHIAKDIKKRKRTNNNEITKKITKFLLYGQYSDPIIKTNMRLMKQLFIIRGNKSKLVNHCTVTGRSRGLVKHFKISRIILKKFMTKGLLHGVTKSSW
jgi:ribosomal protein S14